MVSTFYPPYHFGGDAAFVYRLSNELAQRGHRVDVIHDRDSYYILHPREPTASFENHPNVTVYSLKSRLGILSPLATQQTGQPFLKRTIKELLDSDRYDVVHFHNISLIGPGAMNYGRALKLMTLHEHWLICPMHVLWKFNREVCTRRQCFLCTLYGRRPPQLWRYTDFLPRQLAAIDQFISPSRFSREKHHEMGLDLPITVLPYFVPKPPDGPQGDAPAHPRPYFLFVGRLVKIKGLQTLLPLFKEYQRADLIVAGEGDYGPTLQALARDIPNISFVGNLPHSKLDALYRHALAVIAPSIGYEVLPNVILEALAHRTPVLARDLGGMPEPVQDSNGGLVYHTAEELVQAMTRLQEDPVFREQCGESGYEAYLKMWHVEPHLKRYFEIIQEASKRKRKARRETGRE